ncbi:MAG: vanadium-dependent haloperoxidase [Pseudomonadota bacterium]
MTDDRRQTARAIRIEAAETAFSREHPKHLANGDEQAFAAVNYAMSFTKGLAHSPDHGLVKEAADFEALRTAIDNGFIDPFTATVPGVMAANRPWEAPTAGVVYDLEGPDAQAVTMAPAPAAGSDELTYEMAEVYWLAVLRDCPFSVFATPGGLGADLEDDDDEDDDDVDDDEAHAATRPHRRILRRALRHLNRLPYNPAAKMGRPRISTPRGFVRAGTVFRGSSPGVDVGPYLSQFMLIGNSDQLAATTVDSGQIVYGAQLIDQKVPVVNENPDLGDFSVDFMTTPDTWRAAQDGQTANDNSLIYSPGAGRRFICTPRDLATYVHFDALYQAYLNAALILLGMGAPFDPGFDALSGQGSFRFNNGPVDTASVPDEPSSPSTVFPRKAGGFALYGGPHILTLVTEVATRALKAVRFQKFNNHIRLRPEALAGRVHFASEIESTFPAAGSVFSEMESDLEPVTNIIENGTGNKFLPMAFPEGSPMHPAYGAGHATVAGACVTILKAFFDTGAVFVRPGGAGQPTFKAPSAAADVAAVFVPDDTGATLQDVASPDDKPLTLEGELNKLAANISIGRNMAGVHYFSDYFDSLRMGEEIAIGMLEEQALGYRTDPFVLSLPTFDGPIRRIGRR